MWLPLFSKDIQLTRPRNTVFLGAQIHFQRPKKYKRMIILVWNCGRSVASCPAPPLIICCSNSHVSAQTTNDWKDIPVSPTLNFSLCSSQVACFDTYMQKNRFEKTQFFSESLIGHESSQLDCGILFLRYEIEKRLRAIQVAISNSPLSILSTLDLQSYQRNFSPSKPKPFVAHLKR